MAERHDPFAALRQRTFQFYLVSRFGGGMAMMLVQSALFWQVYDITGSKWQIAITGLVQFIPSLGLSLVAGALADSIDRRKISVVAQSLMALAIGGLCINALSSDPQLAAIYGLILINGTAGVFDAPARAGILPLTLTKETFANGIVVSGVAQQLSFVSGPALGGLLIWLSGVGLAFGVAAGLIASSVLITATLRLRIEDIAKRAVSLQGIVEGVRFVRRRPEVLGSMTLDMFAVIFGGATALLPIYAREILDVGSLGYGLLLGAIDGGALIMSLVMVFVPLPKRPGKVLLFAVAGFGLATIIFGLSRSFALSLTACALIGMSDQVSVVMRQTTIQLATPDALRGRVTSVNMLFIGASNRLGAVESGAVAALTTTTFAVVSGGFGTLAVLGAVAWKMPGLARYRTDAKPVEVVGEATPAAAATAAGGS
ncbi:MAG: MFS transporter [Dehalococcoidia bacterium]